MSITKEDAARRAQRLQRESIVVDAQSIFETTPLATPRMLETYFRGFEGVDIVDAIMSAVDDAMVRDEYDEYWQWHHEAGVDVVSVTLGGGGDPPFGFDAAVRDCAHWTWRFDHEPRFRKVTCVADARAAHARGQRGVILNFQNSTHLNDRIENLDFFHRLGLRVIGMAYNTNNALAGGCTAPDKKGLTSLGRDAVRRMNELGILIDVSHASEQTAFDALEVSKAPIAVTHASCSGLYKHDRGKSDALIKAIGEAKGFFGVCTVPCYLTSDDPPKLSALLDHIDHAVKFAGVAHVGIGTDWSAGGYTADVPESMLKIIAEREPESQRAEIEMLKKIGFREEHLVNLFARLEGFQWYRQWPAITRGLVERGYSDGEIKGLLGENWLRVFEAAVG